MQWNRRQFVTTSSLGLIGVLGSRSLLAQAPAAQPPTGHAVPDVRRNISVFTASCGTNRFHDTPDPVVAVYSQCADTAPIFLEGLKPRTSRKIDFQINSHQHYDHTGGNKVLQPAVAKI